MIDQSHEYTLGKLGAMMEGMQGEVTRTCQLMEKRMDSHSTRLGSLERWRAYITGAVAVLAFMVGLLGLTRMLSISQLLAGGQ